jgi:hypothetical protein
MQTNSLQLYYQLKPKDLQQNFLLQDLLMKIQPMQVLLLPIQQ